MSTGCCRGLSAKDCFAHQDLGYGCGDRPERRPAMGMQKPAVQKATMRQSAKTNKRLKAIQKPPLSTIKKSGRLAKR